MSSGVDWEKLKLEKWKLPCDERQLKYMLQLVQASVILDGAINEAEAVILINAIMSELDRIANNS